MNQAHQHINRTNAKAKPWLGDDIVRAEAKYSPELERQLIKRQLLLATLISILFVGWSLVLLTGIVWALSYVAFSAITIYSALCLWVSGYVYCLIRWWNNFHAVDDEFSVTRNDAPALFELIDEISLKLGDGKIDKVILGDNFSAFAITGRHKHWWGGQKKMHIQLDLMLFHALTEKDIKTIIAHEVHHLLGDNRSGEVFVYFARCFAWFARQHIAWWPVENQIGVFEREICALQFVRAKFTEKAADNFEVDACSPRESAIAFLKGYSIGTELKCAGPYQKPGFFLESETPPEDRVGLEVQFLKALLSDRVKLKKRMKRQLNGIVGVSDIHPPLKHRVLTGFDVSQDTRLDELVDAALASCQENSCEHLLGDSLQRITKEKNEFKWKKWCKNWKTFFENHQRLKKELVPPAEVATTTQAWAHYYSVKESSGEANAQRWLKEVLKLSPSNLRATSLAAIFDLQDEALSNKNAAVATLHRLATESSPSVAEDSLNKLSIWYRGTGDHQKLWNVERDLALLEPKKKLLSSEKQPSFFGKYFSPLTEGDVLFERYQQVPEWQKHVKAIYVAQKEITHCTETRYLVFALQFRALSDLSEKVTKGIINSYRYQISNRLAFQNISFDVVNRRSMVGLRVRCQGIKVDD